MSHPTLDQHVEITPGVCGGKPRITGRRITVQNIATCCVRLGLSPDEVAQQYDITLADVHAALAYYFDHRDEIDRSIADDELFVETLREKTPSKMAAKLKQRQDEPNDLILHGRACGQRRDSRAARARR
jgi:uncharacterized protein (DUF433 family)